MATPEQSVLPMIMAVLGVSVMAQVLHSMTPVLAVPPVPTFECPLDGLLFYTYDELYAHFTTAHPTESIDIVWE